MCGIAGQFHLHNKRVGSSVTPIKAVDIEKMCQAMQHRGPNQQAVRLWKHGGFGFRRLSIIDLSDNGQQPMANEDESLWLIFNGEIYNYRSLRDELQKLGHRFRSDTDSEVVLHGFEAWGKKLLDKIEGMYAFALYRPDDHYLLLVRDPFGIKPLYYYQNQQQLIFASEIRPLLKYEFIKPQLDRSQLFHYFTLGYVPNPNTMFVGIHKLPPGHYLELHNEKIALQRYWDLQEHKNSATLQESLQSLDVNLKKNLQQSLISDVPLGVFLSGGLDSTLLTFYSQSVSQEKLKTFAIGFKDNPHFDETKKSDYVAKTLQTDHYSLQIEEDASMVLPKAIRALEEPLADPSIIPTYHLAAMTKQFVTVALSGEGGDELFGGYNRYLWEPRAQKLSSWLRCFRPLLPLLNKIPTPEKQGLSNWIRRLRKFLQTSHLSKAERYLSWFALLTHQQIENLVAIKNPETTSAPSLALFEQFFQQATFSSNLRRLQYIDIKTMLVDNLLLKADKIGMSHSLEMRVPLLNRDFSVKLFNLPDELKIHQGTSKFIERQLLKPHFANDFIEQRKQGFEVPIGNWLRQQGKSLMTEYLSPKRLAHGVLNVETVNTLMQQHLDGKRDWGLPLFAIIVLNIWIEEFKVQCT